MRRAWTGRARCLVQTGASGELAEVPCCSVIFGSCKNHPRYVVYRTMRLNNKAVYQIGFRRRYPPWSRFCGPDRRLSAPIAALFTLGKNSDRILSPCVPSRAHARYRWGSVPFFGSFARITYKAKTAQLAPSASLAEGVSFINLGSGQ
jgi:hypothetical protein